MVVDCLLETSPEDNIKSKKIFFLAQLNFSFSDQDESPITTLNESHSSSKISIKRKASTEKINYSTIENLELEYISMEKLLPVCCSSITYIFTAFIVVCACQQFNGMLLPSRFYLVD